MTSTTLDVPLSSSILDRKRKGLSITSSRSYKKTKSSSKELSQPSTVATLSAASLMDQTGDELDKPVISPQDRHIAIEKTNGKPGKPGVVYLGRIPHGFYENEMRSYFSQFGEINRLRLCRNKITGKSKHYAFIEFASREVADIAADTMNNYLLYGHILKCKVVPESECASKMWAVANRKWKSAPSEKIRRIQHDRKKSTQAWSQIQKREERRRTQKADKWRSSGVDYDFEEPHPRLLPEPPETI